MTTRTASRDLKMNINGPLVDCVSTGALLGCSSATLKRPGLDLALGNLSN